MFLSTWLFRSWFSSSQLGFLLLRIARCIRNLIRYKTIVKTINNALIHSTIYRISWLTDLVHIDILSDAAVFKLINVFLFQAISCVDDNVLEFFLSSHTTLVNFSDNLFFEFLNSGVLSAICDLNMPNTYNYPTFCTIDDT